uniref:Uncharacterized protein n=1 Tax=Heterorhabditis bacteriophora TaxID=37862 RepID=A0A1I7WXS7_HETBA
MDIIEEKINELIEFRDGYVEENPNANEAERVKAVRKRALLLIQEIPFSECPVQAAAHHLLCGRIINICIDYEPRCEEYLKRNQHLWQLRLYQLIPNLVLLISVSVMLICSSSSALLKQNLLFWCGFFMLIVKIVIKFISQDQAISVMLYMGVCRDNFLFNVTSFS